MALDVKIIINTVKPIGNIGFGCPLILEENATAGKEYKEVSSLSALVEAGYAVDSKVYKVAELMFMQEYAPRKIAVCSVTTPAKDWLTVEANCSKSWRQLLVVNASADKETAVADIITTIEAQTKYPKIYYANVDFDDDTEFVVKDIERTVICYYTPTENVPCPVAALVGNVAGLEVGSYTLNNMVVKGIAGMDISEEEIEAIHAKGGITFVISAGDVVASEGITAGGKFVDNVDGNDYIKQQLEYKTQKVFNNNLKVPYTNAGIGMLEAAANEVMTDAVGKGIIESYEVAYALRDDVAESDRTARKYVGGNIKYSMAGAVHKIEINCEASL